MKRAKEMDTRSHIIIAGLLLILLIVVTGLSVYVQLPKSEPQRHEGDSRPKNAPQKGENGVNKGTIFDAVPSSVIKSISHLPFHQDAASGDDITSNDTNPSQTGQSGVGKTTTLKEISKFRTKLALKSIPHPPSLQNEAITHVPKATKRAGSNLTETVNEVAYKGNVQNEPLKADPRQGLFSSRGKNDHQRNPKRMV